MHRFFSVGWSEMQKSRAFGSICTEISVYTKYNINILKGKKLKPAIFFQGEQVTYTNCKFPLSLSYLTQSSSISVCRPYLACAVAHTNCLWGEPMWNIIGKKLCLGPWIWWKLLKAILICRQSQLHQLQHSKTKEFLEIWHSYLMNFVSEQIFT